MGYLKATVQFAMKHSEIGADFTRWLKDLTK
jgi:UTP-glucose-1-phosphate uridylyltransferase